MQLGYTILYVPDVPAALQFYEQAFGLTLKFLHESNQYGEMNTGTTTLAFVSEEMASHNGLTFRPNHLQETPAGIEIAFVTAEVAQAYQKAVSAGAEAVLEPITKPWGQIVSYVRDLNGILVEICSPISV